MVTDDLRCQVLHQIHSRSVRAFSRFLTPAVFAQAASEVGVCIVRSPLNLVNLVWLGLACALDTAQSFSTVLTATLKILTDAPHPPLSLINPPAQSPGLNNRSARRAARARSKHDPKGQVANSVTEEAFVQARARMPMDFWVALALVLADRFAREHADHLRWKHFRLLALDGTLVNLPRYKPLAKHYGTAKGRRGGRIPQARLVMLQFPLARVPYRFALGTKHQAEKTMAEPLLKALGKDDLLLIDRGFWSYGLFCQIVEQEAYFCIRQIAQVKLKRLRTLGPDDTLVRWTPTGRKWRKQGLPESMELRRIVYQVRGFRRSALITNVTDPAVISRREWVGMTTVHEAGRVLDDSIYHRRWEIETSFSELKCFQHMKKLRGRTRGTIDYEIASHVLLYLLVRWLMMESASEAGVDPLLLSFVDALREIDTMKQTLITASPVRVRNVLLPRLLQRIAEHRVLPRPGRHFPRPNDTKVKNLGRGKKRIPSKLGA